MPAIGSCWPSSIFRGSAKVGISSGLVRGSCSASFGITAVFESVRWKPPRGASTIWVKTNSFR